MRRRIFIAINLPEEIKKELISYQKQWPGTLLRWTKKENLHITLIFIGYVGDQETAEICRLVKEAASRHSAFSLKLNRICFGPTGKYGPESREVPRMIWVQGEESQELSLLKKNLEKALVSSKDSGYQGLEERDFSPHITLARIRQWDWRRIEPEERPDIDEEISLSFEVSSVEVMESVLGPKGPEYTILTQAHFFADFGHC